MSPESPSPGAPSTNERLARLRRARPDAGIFLDFDGTLSPIVARPELARAVEGAAGVLEGLVAAYAVVGIITGRRGAEVHRLLGVDGLAVFGLYGLEGREIDTAGVRRARAEVEAAASAVPGAWVEDKGASLAVHYRASPDPDRASQELTPRLERVAVRRGLVLLPGKMVVELAPAETPGKGSVILREARARRLDAVLYAGDDQADLGAFAALAELASDQRVTVRIAVRSAETPDALVREADAVVDGPGRLVELLATIT